MGSVIVKQPDDQYAMFSSVVDNFIYTDADAEGLAVELAQEAYKRTYEAIMKRIARIDEGQAERFFGEPMTWDACISTISWRGGSDGLREIAEYFENWEPTQAQLETADIDQAEVLAEREDEGECA